MSENRPEILILSHGTLCEGLKDSAVMLAGGGDHIKVLPLLEGQDPDEYYVRALKLYNSMPYGSIILVDILGGTPSNTVIKMMRECEVFALCGVNLATVVCALFERDNKAGAELLNSVMEDSDDSIVNLYEKFKGLK